MNSRRGLCLHILSLALGGCLRGEPVSYGITEDTGGHITYILGEMRALAKHQAVTSCEIVTRLFDVPELGAIHAQRQEWLGPKLRITRIDSGNRRYLAKADLVADRSAFCDALIAELRSRDHLPDIIHAHFADAADVARRVEQELGIAFIYTAHSLGMDKLASSEGSTALHARIAEEDAAIRHASAIVGSSRDECERQIGAYPSARIDTIHRLEPGIDCGPRSDAALDAARDLVAPFLRDARKPIVLAIARPVRKKNLIALVEAFGAHPTLRDSCNLVVLAGQRGGLDSGEAEQREVLTQLIAAIDRHDLYGSIAYPKQHDNRAVAGLYALAAESGGVFVNPALVEPYGLTICEAAAYGLPVIATNIGGPVDSIAQLDHGVLIDPTDRTKLAAAIMQLVGDRAEWQRLSQNGRRNSATMSWDRYADGIVSLAQTIVRNKTVRHGSAADQVRSLVVSDLDNTLTGCNDGAHRLSEFFARHGRFGFVAATGRSIIEAQRIVREWRLPQPLAWITSTGSEIYWQGRAGLERDPDYSDAIDTGWAPVSVERALTDIAGLRPQPIYEQRDFKRSYFYDSPAVLALVHDRLKMAGLSVQIIASHGNLLDILPQNAGKGPAMQHVAQKCKVDGHRIFAIGDSGNDSDMLTLCENAVMVGNYAPEISHLSTRPNIYVARRHHAAGALEGIFAHYSRQKRLDAARRTAS